MKTNGMKALLVGIAGFVLIWNLGSCNLDPLPEPDPTSTPSPVPSQVPVPTPTVAPTAVPITNPSPTPSPVPVSTATPSPTPTPSLAPSPSPSPTPSLAPSPSPTPTSVPPGNLAGAIRPQADQAQLLHSALTASSFRCSMSLGKALAYNTYVPWSMTSSSTLWFPVLVESGKTYTVNWDDGYGSSGFYSLDIMLGAYTSPVANDANRISSWVSDQDTGYSTGKTFTAGQTQVLYFKVVPFTPGDVGSFALQVNCSSAANDSQSFAWYLDGNAISAANSYLYTLDTSSLASGKHVLMAIAARDGTSWSESWEFTK